MTRAAQAALVFPLLANVIGYADRTCTVVGALLVYAIGYADRTCTRRD